MRRRIAVLAAAALGLLGSTAQAAASTPPEAEAALQLAGQAAAGAQSAGALSGASQSQPANQNIAVRVLSPGDSGSVSQSNSVDSSASAGNANVTGQSAGQTQASSCPCGSGTQAVGQQAANDQDAKALSAATQSGASNTNVPVRVLSPGNDGSVSQSNSVESDATAANLNATGQSAGQTAAGGTGTQAVGQSAQSEQDAAAASKADQTGAKNTNVSVRVLSPGNDGSVSQSNSVDSQAKAGNVNLTGQDADQTQAGAGGTQAIGQTAKSDQHAGALSAAKQDGASNTNVSVRVLSPGDGGSVRQSNTASSSAAAGNLNATKQDADQAQAGAACGCGSAGIQAVGQSAASEQKAGALSAALQDGASNSSTPVRVASPGNDGSVAQRNSVSSDATALNLNLTKQDADQHQTGAGACCGVGVQAIGQSAQNDQAALAASLAAQSGGHARCGCPSGGNSHSPVRVGSDGHGGSVWQSNDVSSSAKAANLNATEQEAGQAQSAGGGVGVQAIGQSAKSEQAAAALSAALQHGASNSSSPVRVHSKGHDGAVSQTNAIESDATALNANLTGQSAAQYQRAGTACGCGAGIQAIGQEAKSSQAALAGSLALQLAGRDRCGCTAGGNTSTPVRVGSYGSAGSLAQANTVGSSAKAANLNATKQAAGQAQSGAGVQAIGQSARSGQAALALSAALQLAGAGRLLVH